MRYRQSVTQLFRVTLIAGLLCSFQTKSETATTIHSTPLQQNDISQMTIVTENESDDAKSRRELAIKEIIKQYKIKPAEAYVYLKNDIHGLDQFKIIYRNYSTTDKAQFVYLDEMSATGQAFTIPDDAVTLLKDIDKQDYGSRIAPSVLAQRPGGGVDTAETRRYRQLKETMLHQLIDSRVCETVYSAEIYSFGGVYLVARCGDGMEIQYTQRDMENHIPPERVLKEIYVEMSHQKKSELQERSR